MRHKHRCPNCGEEKWCEIDDCIFGPSDESVCDDCADAAADHRRKNKAEKAARAAEEDKT